MIKARLLILFFFICIEALYAQDYEIKRLPINNNGGSNTIRNQILFDEDGVLWYNTHNGMVKEFESSHIFYPFMDGKKAIQVTRVNSIILDTKGRFWVNTTEGIFRSDTSKENFQKLHWSILDGIQSYKSFIVEDCSGKIWIAISNIQILKITSDTEFELVKIAKVPTEDENLDLTLKNASDCDHILLEKGPNYFVISKDTSQLSEIPVQYRLQDYDYDYYAKNRSYNLFKNGDVFPEDFEGFYNYNGKRYKVIMLKSLNMQLAETAFGLTSISRIKNPVLKERIDFFMSHHKLGRTFGFLKLIKENGEYHLKKSEEISFDHLAEYFAVAKNGIIYVSVFDQIYKIKFKNKGFKKSLYNQKDQGKRINISTRDFLEISERELLVATYEGMFKLNVSPAKNSVDKLNVFSKLDYLRAYVKVNDSIALSVGETALVSINYINNEINKYK